MAGPRFIFVVTEANVLYREHRIHGPKVIGLFDTTQAAKVAL